MTTPSIPQNPTNVDVLLAFVRLEGKVDSYMTTVSDHETRIRVLEARRWPLPVVVALSSVAAAGAAAAGLILAT